MVKKKGFSTDIALPIFRLTSLSPIVMKEFIGNTWDT